MIGLANFSQIYFVFKMVGFRVMLLRIVFDQFVEDGEIIEQWRGGRMAQSY